MAIIKDKLKIKNSNDIIYPETSVSQIVDINKIQFKYYSARFVKRDGSTNNILYCGIVCVGSTYVRVNEDINDLESDGNILFFTNLSYKQDNGGYTSACYLYNDKPLKCLRFFYIQSGSAVTIRLNYSEYRLITQSVIPDTKNIEDIAKYNIEDTATYNIKLNDNNSVNNVDYLEELL